MVVLLVLQRCILDIVVQGAKSMRDNTLDARFFFICPPSFEYLEKHLCGRYIQKYVLCFCTESSEVIYSPVLVMHEEN